MLQRTITFSIDQAGDDVIVKLLPASDYSTKPVVTVTWDGMTKGKVEVTQNYIDSLANGAARGQIVCGLCGNYDGDADNDVKENDVRFDISTLRS